MVIISITWTPSPLRVSASSWLPSGPGITLRWVLHSPTEAISRSSASRGMILTAYHAIQWSSSPFQRYLELPGQPVPTSCCFPSIIFRSLRTRWLLPPKCWFCCFPGPPNSKVQFISTLWYDPSMWVANTAWFSSRSSAANERKASLFGPRGRIIVYDTSFLDVFFIIDWFSWNIPSPFCPFACSVSWSVPFSTSYRTSYWNPLKPCAKSWRRSGVLAYGGCSSPFWHAFLSFPSRACKFSYYSRLLLEQSTRSLTKSNEKWTCISNCCLSWSAGPSSPGIEETTQICLHRLLEAVLYLSCSPRGKLSSGWFSWSFFSPHLLLHEAVWLVSLLLRASKCRKDLSPSNSWHFLLFFS